MLHAERNLEIRRVPVPVPWQITLGHGPVVATAIHAGHDVRPDVAAYMAITEDDRRREEDPLTGYWTTVGDSSVLVLRSRFEIDLNRPRDAAIVKDPKDAWGLAVWRELPPAQVLDASLEEYDRFYAEVEMLINELLRHWQHLLVLDLHSYNHRRDGPDGPPADPGGNPDINVGTGTMQREQWAHAVDTFIASFRNVFIQGRAPDVRENINFRGGHFPQWLHSHFPAKVCVLSIECKKLFMDEWTAQADIKCLDDLRRALLEATDATRPLFDRAV
jgi:hypothetical protein